ncbi:MAG TPA: hypothetical protein VIM34_07355 [Burkholderiaceae bacterium]
MRCNIEQAALGQPTQMRGRPAAFAGIGDAVAQQQGLEPMACVAALAHRVLAGRYEVTVALLIVVAAVGRSMRAGVQWQFAV